MRLGHRGLRVATVSALATLALASLASAQERAGVVTTLEGKVTVARASAPELSPLKFRDAVFVRDRIATGKDSFARILLGGRAVVTIREYSAVTITEVPGVATVDVVSGRAAVAVARERMRPGDLVEVRTPNAVAGIRGTVIVAEVFDPRNSVITVLKGVIDVTRRDGGQLVGASTILNALQQVTITQAVSAPQAISSDVARRMRDEFRTSPPKGVPAESTAAVSDAEMDRVAKDLGGSIVAPTAVVPTAWGAIGAQSDQPESDSDKGKGKLSGTAVVSTGGTPTTAATPPTASSGDPAMATPVSTAAPAPPASSAPVTSAPAPVSSAPAPATTTVAPVTTAAVTVPIAATAPVTTTVTSTTAAASAPVTTSPVATATTTGPIYPSSGKEPKLPKPEKIKKY